MMKISPLAPDQFPALPVIAGVHLAGGACGLKRNGKLDLLLATFDDGTTVAGTLTRSKCPSAPVDWCRRVLPAGRARGLVVNSANANAFTGGAGDETVRHTVAAAAQLLGCANDEVFVASTGVIGEPVPADHIGKALPGLADALSPSDWEKAAAAIMTTDTYPKAATRRAVIGSTEVVLNGIAKGSGMIAPDMATMLSFMFTDAAIPAPVLQKLMGRAVGRSFNSITVDSDTSTSDTVLAFATGKADHPPVTRPDDPWLSDFRMQLESLCIDLAQQVVCDGEGAEKFVSIHVSGAASARAARRVGLAIANSPLVKTAIAGEDANWGRIVMAVGKAGEKADRDRLRIAIGDTVVAVDGQRRPDYDEAPVATYMKGRDIELSVDLGVGRGKATVWTCDLTHGYISINADYRS